MGRNSGYAGVHDRAWHHLLDEAPNGLAADVALVQEAVPPAWVDPNRLLWTRAWDSRPWGTGIVVTQGQVLTPIAFDVPGSRLVLGRLVTDRGDMAIASIHAHSEGVIPALTETFAALRRDLGEMPFVVGGDLNTARSAEKVWPGFGHQGFWESLDATGFYTCFWGEHGREAKTYKHLRGAFDGQADHILIDAATAAQAEIQSWVDDGQPDLSDHLALVVDLNPKEPSR